MEKAKERAKYEVRLRVKKDIAEEIKSILNNNPFVLEIKKSGYHKQIIHNVDFYFKRTHGDGTVSLFGKLPKRNAPKLKDKLTRRKLQTVK